MRWGEVLGDPRLSITRELASFWISLPYSVKLGSAMSVSDREADENIVFIGEMPSKAQKNKGHHIGDPRNLRV